MGYPCLTPSLIRMMHGIRSSLTHISNYEKCLYQLKSNIEASGHRCATVQSIANLKRLLKPLAASARRHPARSSSGKSAPHVFPPMNGSCADVLAPVFGRWALWIRACVPKSISCVRSGSSMPVSARPHVFISPPYSFQCGSVISSPRLFAPSLSDGSVDSDPPFPQGLESSCSLGVAVRRDFVWRFFFSKSRLLACTSLSMPALSPAQILLLL